MKKLTIVLIMFAFAIPVGVSAQTICTADAMQCPDGSYVGRSGPNCEFVCPGANTCPMLSPPSPEFCPSSRIRPNYDKGCVVGYICVAAGYYDLGPVTLRIGSRGTYAMELQKFLNDRIALGLVVDGVFGPRTHNAVVTWQLQNGLVADGLVGPRTKASINGGVF